MLDKDAENSVVMCCSAVVMCCSAVVMCWTGKVNAYGWLRYSGFARHKDPQLDAAGALADLLVFSLNLTGLDILQKIENQDNSW